MQSIQDGNGTGTSSCTRIGTGTRQMKTEDVSGMLLIIVALVRLLILIRDIQKFIFKNLTYT